MFISDYLKVIHCKTLKRQEILPKILTFVEERKKFVTRFNDRFHLKVPSDLLIQNKIFILVI